jgi:hypothetical protein
MSVLERGGNAFTTLRIEKRLQAFEEPLTERRASRAYPNIGL